MCVRERERERERDRETEGEREKGREKFTQKFINWAIITCRCRLHNQNLTYRFTQGSIT